MHKFFIFLLLCYSYRNSFYTTRLRPFFLVDKKNRARKSNADSLKGRLRKMAPSMISFSANIFVEDDVARREEGLLDEFARFLSAVPAIHTLIFPFDGKRPVVANVI